MASTKIRTEQLTNADGWTPVNDTWTYSSVDGPTGVITIPSDGTAKYSVGMRVKFTQTTVKYFIVTAVAATTLTVYGGTDYTLANAAISAISFSMVKSPLGFPVSPSKWTVEVKDTNIRVTATPTSNQWYNPGSNTISLPIGVWNTRWEAGVQINDGTPGYYDNYVSLSTANNSESDTELTCFASIYVVTGCGTFFGREKVLSIAAKTSYYLVQKIAVSGADNMYLRGDASPTIIRAVCAYL